MQRAFEAVDDGSGTLSKGDFEELLESLGLGARPPDKDEGVPSPSQFRVRADEWWAATDVYKAGRIGIGEAVNALPERIYAALDEDRKQRNKIVAYRESLLMEAEDFDAEDVAEEDLDPIQRELRRPTLQYKPFAVEHKQLAPPPPMWRRGGATGEPCDAPPVQSHLTCSAPGSWRRPATPATTDALQSAITRGCAALHYSGHGHPQCLTFEDGRLISERGALHHALARFGGSAEVVGRYNSSRARAPLPAALGRPARGPPLMSAVSVC